MARVKRSPPVPTTPDLVVLAMLAEGPRHGYALNAELERREVRDWAGISRPQVYYSLHKLLRAGWVRPAAGQAAWGPERTVVELTTVGRRALEDALERADWATRRPPPPFLTWLALSWLARPGVLPQMVAARRAFLRQEVAKERVTLDEIAAELGAGPTVPALMVQLAIRQFEVELAWLDEVEALQRLAGAPRTSG